MFFKEVTSHTDYRVTPRAVPASLCVKQPAEGFLLFVPGLESSGRGHWPQRHPPLATAHETPGELGWLACCADRCLHPPLSRGCRLENVLALLPLCALAGLGLPRRDFPVKRSPWDPRKMALRVWMLARLCFCWPSPSASRLCWSARSKPAGAAPADYHV